MQMSFCCKKRTLCKALGLVVHKCVLCDKEGKRRARGKKVPRNRKSFVRVRHLAFSLKVFFEQASEVEIAQTGARKLTEFRSFKR